MGRFLYIYICHGAMRSTFQVSIFHVTSPAFFMGIYRIGSNAHMHGHAWGLEHDGEDIRVSSRWLFSILGPLSARLPHSQHVLRLLYSTWLMNTSRDFASITYNIYPRHNICFCHTQPRLSCLSHTWWDATITTIIYLLLVSNGILGLNAGPTPVLTFVVSSL